MPSSERHSGRGWEPAAICIALGGAPVPWPPGFDWLVAAPALLGGKLVQIPM